jgi:hypothetical protein
MTAKCCQGDNGRKRKKIAKNKRVRRTKFKREKRLKNNITGIRKK